MNKENMVINNNFNGNSYTRKIGVKGSLKVYFDIKNMDQTETDLKNFYKIIKFIHALESVV